MEIFPNWTRKQISPAIYQVKSGALTRNFSSPALKFEWDNPNIFEVHLKKKLLIPEFFLVEH